jgi:hypothetical protein
LPRGSFVRRVKDIYALTPEKYAGRPAYRLARVSTTDPNAEPDRDFSWYGEAVLERFLFLQGRRLRATRPNGLNRQSGGKVILRRLSRKRKASARNGGGRGEELHSHRVLPPNVEAAPANGQDRRSLGLQAGAYKPPTSANGDDACRVKNQRK